jgi:hypothetical protein
MKAQLKPKGRTTMPKLNITDYYSRVEKLHHQVYQLVSQHRNWVEARTKDSLFAFEDARLLGQIIAELGKVMHAIETGHVDEIDRADRAALEHIRKGFEAPTSDAAE